MKNKKTKIIILYHLNDKYCVNNNKNENID